MTAASAQPSVPPRSGISLTGIVRLAVRELRSGVRGFQVFIACVALGVMVITGVGALSDALRSGFERQGEMILGGDAVLTRSHVRASSAERDWLAARGTISETATMRTMARRLDLEDQALVELKAVDAAYPLAGAIALSGGMSLGAAVHAGPSAAVDPILLDRLGIAVGGKMKLGEAEVTVAGTIASEPDGLTDRLTYGPRVLVSLETLQATQLVQPGSLVRWRYALKLHRGAGDRPEALATLRAEVKSQLPESGFSVTDRRNPSPQISRTLERLRQFLTLLGLTALLVGGVGVANAVATFIDKRRKVIATMKSLGATGRTVFAVFLVQVMVMAAAGIAIGLACGYAIPVALSATIGSELPIAADLSVTPASVAIAVSYGLLVALLFTVWPLGRAELVSASVLFRDEVDPKSAWPKPYVVGVTVVIAALLVAFAVVSSDTKLLALGFCAGLVVVFMVFLGLGEAVTRLARRMPRLRKPELALAMGNLGAPGGLTRSVVLSLGAGLSLLVAVALADASLVDELTSRLPAQSPDYFVLDIPKSEYPALAGLVETESPGAQLAAAPMLRGRLVRLKDIDVDEIKAPPEAQWVLSGDRGLSYSEDVPAGSKVVAGAWWPAGYSGEPLVSFEADLAKDLGLALGDSVSVNVLGRNLTARIANLREVKWESLALNFVMVFSPNALETAPHNLLATITLPAATPLEAEVRLARALGKAFPAVSAIRVKDAINAFNAILSKVMTAVRVAGGVTLLAGALVLAGALATAQRRRILEAVILKTLGATRRRILLSHFVEYVSLAAVTAVFAVALGTLAAWLAVNEVMEVDFTFSWVAVGQAVVLSIALVSLFGGVGTWSILRAKSVPYLRTE